MEKLISIIEVSDGKGSYVPLEIYEDEDPMEIAQAFVECYDLPLSSIMPLTAQIIRATNSNANSKKSVESTSDDDSDTYGTIEESLPSQVQVTSEVNQTDGIHTPEKILSLEEIAYNRIRDSWKKTAPASGRSPVKLVKQDSRVSSIQISSRSKSPSARPLAKQDVFNRMYKTAEDQRNRLRILRKNVEKEKDEEVDNSKFKNSIGHTRNSPARYVKSRTHKSDKTFYQKLYEDEFLMLNQRQNMNQEKRKMKREEELKKELSLSTFKPTIYTSPKNRLKSSTNIYEDLYNSRQLYDQKKENLREIFQEQFSNDVAYFVPRINEKSKNLAKKLRTSRIDSPVKSHSKIQNIELKPFSYSVDSLKSLKKSQNQFISPIAKEGNSHYLTGNSTGNVFKPRNKSNNSEKVKPITSPVMIGRDTENLQKTENETENLQETENESDNLSVVSVSYSYSGMRKEKAKKKKKKERSKKQVKQLSYLEQFLKRYGAENLEKEETETVKYSNKVDKNPSTTDKELSEKPEEKEINVDFDKIKLLNESSVKKSVKDQIKELNKKTKENPIKPKQNPTEALTSPDIVQKHKNSNQSLQNLDNKSPEINFSAVRNLSNQLRQAASLSPDQRGFNQIDGQGYFHMSRARANSGWKSVNDSRRETRSLPSGGPNRRRSKSMDGSRSVSRESRHSFLVNRSGKSIFERLYEDREEMVPEEPQPFSHKPDIGVNSQHQIESDKNDFFERLYKQSAVKSLNAAWAHIKADRDIVKGQYHSEHQNPTTKGAGQKREGVFHEEMGSSVAPPISVEQHNKCVERLLESGKRTKARLEKQRNDLETARKKAATQRRINPRSEQLAVSEQQQALREIFDVLLVSAQLCKDHLDQREQRRTLYKERLRLADYHLEEAKEEGKVNETNKADKQNNDDHTLTSAETRSSINSSKNKNEDEVNPPSPIDKEENVEPLLDIELAQCQLLQPKLLADAVEFVLLSRPRTTEERQLISREDFVALVEQHIKKGSLPPAGYLFTQPSRDAKPAHRRRAQDAVKGATDHRRESELRERPDLAARKTTEALFKRKQEKRVKGEQTLIENLLEYEDERANKLKAKRQEMAEKRKQECPFQPQLLPAPPQYAQVKAIASAGACTAASIAQRNTKPIEKRVKREARDDDSKSVSATFVSGSTSQLKQERGYKRPSSAPPRNRPERGRRKKDSSDRNSYLSRKMCKELYQSRSPSKRRKEHKEFSKEPSRLSRGNSQEWEWGQEIPGNPLKLSSRPINYLFEGEVEAYSSEEIQKLRLLSNPGSVNGSVVGSGLLSAKGHLYGRS